MIGILIAVLIAALVYAILAALTGSAIVAIVGAVRLGRPAPGLRPGARAVQRLERVRGRRAGAERRLPRRGGARVRRAQGHADRLDADRDCALGDRAGDGVPGRGGGPRAVRRD